jgi:hypothetical protein
MKLQIVMNASSIPFRYLYFSMVDVGSVFVFMVNLYNPLASNMHDHILLPCKEVVRCKNEFFLEFHFSRCLQSLVPAKNNLVCLFPSSLSISDTM